MPRYLVATVDEIPCGGRKIVHVKGREIGIFHVKGAFHALQNICPHQGAPVCLGDVAGTNRPSNPDEYQWEREGEILRCPWHGWEFDLCSGRSLFDGQVRVKTYLTGVENGAVWVEMGQ